MKHSGGYQHGKSISAKHFENMKASCAGLGRRMDGTVYSSLRLLVLHFRRLLRLIDIIFKDSAEPIVQLLGIPELRHGELRQC
jgi:hypothetical protein